MQKMHTPKCANTHTQINDYSGSFQNGTNGQQAVDQLKVQQPVAQNEIPKKASIVQQVIGQFHQDQMRVTSIPYTSTNMVIFSGVPLAKNSYKTNSGKYYVTI